MLRRLIFLAVTATCLSGFGVARAQDNPWSGEPGRFIPQGENGMWAPYGGYPAMSTPYGSVPSPWTPPPPGVVNNGQPLPGYPSLPAPRTVYEFLPHGDTRGPFYETSPEVTRLQQALQGMYLRVDYLNYSLTDPGETLLGTGYPSIDIRDTVYSRFLGVFTSPILQGRERDGTIRTDPGLATIILPQGVDLSPFDFKNRNGVRFTVGVAVENGAFEGNVWSMQSNTDGFSVDPRVVQGTYFVVPAITLLNNGRVPDPRTDPVVPMILFDDSFHVQFRTDLGGAEINYLRNLLPESSPVRLGVIAGARYIRLYEELYVNGRDLTQQVSPQILSTSRNNIFGPSVGLRLELEREWVKLGAETKFMAAFNRHEDLVRTNDLFQFNPGPHQATDAHSEFAPVFDALLYAQVKLTHRLKVRVGYDFLTLFNVSRPQNSIVWNDSAITDGPVLIGCDSTHLETFRARGLSISGEWSLY